MFKREKELNKLINGKSNGLIKVITGMRRCGKSFLLNNIFKTWLLNNGYKEYQIIQFAFDSKENVDKLDNFNKDEETRIYINKEKNIFKINSKKFLSYVNSLINNETNYVLLLDEIQLLEDFTSVLNTFLYKNKLDIYVTGSNSLFLSNDIATTFRGRSYNINLYPLTFKEIYDESFEKNNTSKLINDYMMYGGLPNIVLEQNEENKIDLLKTIYKTTYIRDIAERNSIQNSSNLEEIVSYLSSNIDSLTNCEKIKNTYNSKGNHEISSPTIKNYIEYLKNAYLIDQANRFDIKGKKYFNSNCKYYFVDLGIRNVITNFRQYERNHLMENLIYNELKYRGYNVDVGNIEKYEKNANNTYSKKLFEIDFVINKGFKKFYIQSALNIDDYEKKTQEEKPLNLVNDSFSKIIIVFDDIKSYQDENGIFIISLKDFLLNDLGTLFGSI